MAPTSPNRTPSTPWAAISRSRALRSRHPPGRPGARPRGGLPARRRRGGCDDGPWKSRISEPKQKGFARWHGDDAARRAVTNNRTRLLSGVAREAFKLRAEIVERSFAHNLDRGGMRRTWLRGRENVHKRYLLHVAGHNLSLLMRQLIGAGTPKEAVAGGIGALFVLVTPAGAVLVVHRPHRLRGWRNRLRRDMLRRGVKPGQCATGCYGTNFSEQDALDALGGDF